jgi:hypothetical protein
MYSEKNSSAGAALTCKTDQLVASRLEPPRANKKSWHTHRRITLAGTCATVAAAWTKLSCREVAIDYSLLKLKIWDNDVESVKLKSYSIYNADLINWKPQK